MTTITKWGFGMAPLKPATREKYNSSVGALNHFLGGENVEYSAPLEGISEVKGLVNRCLRQDQWDWFTVYEKFDFPKSQSMQDLPHKLKILRKALATRDHENIETYRSDLQRENMPQLCDSFLENLKERGQSDKIYILSTREERDTLKIGRTSRVVSERVKEINGNTGVLYPYSARAAFKVTDGVLAEKTIHDLLRNHRIRSDREFFNLEYGQAINRIGQELSSKGLYLEQH